MTTTTTTPTFIHNIHTFPRTTTSFLTSRPSQTTEDTLTSHEETLTSFLASQLPTISTNLVPRRLAEGGEAVRMNMGLLGESEESESEEEEVVLRRDTTDEEEEEEEEEEGFEDVDVSGFRMATPMFGNNGDDELVEVQYGDVRILDDVDDDEIMMMEDETDDDDDEDEEGL